MSIRDKFLSRATQFKLEQHEDVWLRPMSKGVKSRVEAIVSKPGNKTAKDCTEARWFALLWSVCDEAGEPILTIDDKNVFDSWDDSFIEPMFEKVLSISGVSEKDKEAFEKN